MSDVRGRLDGRATQVHRDTARYKRDEVAYLAGAGVVQAKAHSVKRSGRQGVPRHLSGTGAVTSLAISTADARRMFRFG
ncbi:hypothetical protein GCM10010193_30900 [Kitasatospora atroaurantiaca]